MYYLEWLRRLMITLNITLNIDFVIRVLLTNRDFVYVNDRYINASLKILTFVILSYKNHHTIAICCRHTPISEGEKKLEG